MNICCLDLEGVLVPEIWIAVAEHYRVDELRATTRDVPDYDELMRGRLALLARHGITLPQIQEVIAQMGPLAGAKDFLDWLRERAQVILLSDTYYEFAMPLMRQLGYPTLLCHRLEADQHGAIVNYILRHRDSKLRAVKAFKELGFKVIAAGDSYNDTAMLRAADRGILYRPPAALAAEFDDLPACRDYAELQTKIESALEI
jgi:phosphoserine / homoserine phosphotransferase